ncbi:hypothetical protein PF005_g6764 [Phytophthora fragariae]|uniref:Uncharacterized protein n=1 Tax=Phytophthora fragariae TaxID=53985 RepID=A0A6A3LU96_9STRA|nr:hypothetical protein PF003_g3246 [Phytophthora fragariae]KAE8944449.1 hypothetical protein PF009_g5863 [Phytophthora fragariae]KAE9021705.1 hypothetical protein PF011_g4808 [Phytophthora fragariae]KAE9123633.1 hypothetical protein PF007_g6982 [Phytophthora fragariae]KAE9124496.1 hypothetical protein PF010_g5978 [Phytophthora fragariae]
MSRVVVLFAIFAAIFAGNSSAKILTFGGWPKTSNPLATVAPADADAGVNFTAAGAHALKTAAPSLKSSRGEDESEDSDDSDSPDSDDTLPARFTIGSVVNATSTIESIYTNWVGSELHTAISSACYRKTHLTKNCPLGYGYKLGACWAQCPYAYPVECGMECIRQNDDCGMEVVTKVFAVTQSLMPYTTMGVFFKFWELAKGFQRAFKCVKSLLGLTKSLIRYIRFLKVSDPQTSQEKLLGILYQTDKIVIDIPVAVRYCLGKKVPDHVKLADRIVTTAEMVLREVMRNSDEIVSTWGNFTNFLKNISMGESVESLNKNDITSLKTSLEPNSTCGYDMKRLLDRTWMTIAEFRKHNPTMSENDIRVAISKSSLVLNDIPIATNNCMGDLIAESNERSAYAMRGTLRKTFGSIVEDLISSGTSSNGSYLKAEEYAFKVADKVAGFYAIWDMWAVGGLISEYLQPICGPTEYVGEIDDGPANKALGLVTVQRAFNKSEGLWTRNGEGSVTITFKSVDTKDVTVNIKSGGDKIDEVDVPSGKTVTWKSNVTALGGKTLYLDRWRPGFLGLPGTGGGLLLLWVPRSAQGSLQLTAVLNTS